MPPWFHEFVRLGAHPRVLAGIAAFSVGTFVLSIVGVPLYLRRLPADYFSRREREGLGMSASHSFGWMARSVLRNALGAVLVVSGLAMFLLPGQGLLTIFVGVMLMDFPGKRRLQRRILSVRPILRAVNALRVRSGQPPFRLAPEDGGR